MLLEFLVPPFSSNGAFVVFDLGTGNGQVCLFYATAGCIPGATQAVVFEGDFTLVPVPAAVWLFGSALLGCLRPWSSQDCLIELSLDKFDSKPISMNPATAGFFISNLAKLDSYVGGILHDNN